MNGKKYLHQTETAVKQLFIALQFYRNQIKDSIPPVYVSQETDEIKWKKEFDDWQEINKEVIDKTLDNQKRYFGFTTSNATICGSILQIAYMGIKTFSTNNKIHPSFSTIISKNNDRQKFCIGKEVRGIPIGLIIYAARNQYNHLDEKLKNKLSTFVFDMLAKFYAGNYKDPAFDLDNPLLSNYSHNVLALLSWDEYEDYLSDMERILGKI